MSIMKPQLHFYIRTFKADIRKLDNIARRVDHVGGGDDGKLEFVAHRWIIGVIHREAVFLIR